MPVSPEIFETYWEEKSGAHEAVIAHPIIQFENLTYDEVIRAYVYYDSENNDKYFFFFEDGVLVKDVIIYGENPIKDEASENINEAEKNIESVENYSCNFKYDGSKAYSITRNFKDYGTTSIGEEYLDHGFSPDLIKEH